MCNLSQEIKEDGIAIGETRFIMKMYKNSFTSEHIASATDKDIEVKAIFPKEDMIVFYKWIYGGIVK